MLLNAAGVEARQLPPYDSQPQAPKPSARQCGGHPCAKPLTQLPARFPPCFRRCYRGPHVEEITPSSLACSWTSADRHLMETAAAAAAAASAAMTMAGTAAATTATVGLKWEAPSSSFVPMMPRDDISHYTRLGRTSALCNFGGSVCALPLAPPPLLACPLDV